MATDWVVGWLDEGSASGEKDPSIGRVGLQFGPKEKGRGSVQEEEVGYSAEKEKKVKRKREGEHPRS